MQKFIFQRRLFNLSAIVFLMLLQACSAGFTPVPVGTIPPAKQVSPEEEKHGHEVLSELTKKYPLDYSHSRYQALLKVVNRLTGAVNAQSQPWHVYLLKDDSVKNAAATRGNHVFVWTGMLDATKDDDELSAILGHEIAHVLARHTDPDPNDDVRRMIIEVGALAAGIAVAAATENPTLGRNAGQATQGISRELGNALARYPYSRERELEADHIGLFLMAKAGYDPNAAIRFWQRATNDPSFSSSLSFFSTHPPAEQRLEKLKALIPRIQQGTGTSSSIVSTGTSIPRPQSKNNSRNLYPSHLTANDSFDVSGANASQSALLEWEVVSRIAILHTKPNDSSKKLGEFRQGATILGVKENDNWVRINSPDYGYIKMQNLTKTVK